MDDDLQIVLEQIKDLYANKEKQIKNLQQLQERNETLTCELSLARQKIIGLEREKNILRFNGKSESFIYGTCKGNCSNQNTPHILSNECIEWEPIKIQLTCDSTYTPSHGNYVNKLLKCAKIKNHEDPHLSLEGIGWLI